MTQPTTFRDLRVWQKSVALVAYVYRISESFPASERFGLASQLRRAAISIPANIAEGNGRVTRGEYLNHLSIARGSLNEVAALCEVSLRLGFVAEAELTPLTAHLDAVGKMLTRLRARLREH